jgi:hypothetical protein
VAVYPSYGNPAPPYPIGIGPPPPSENDREGLPLGNPADSWVMTRLPPTAQISQYAGLTLLAILPLGSPADSWVMKRLPPIAQISQYAGLTLLACREDGPSYTLAAARRVSVRLTNAVTVALLSAQQKQGFHCESH